MKVCSKCGANNGDEAKFCTRCSSAFQSAGNLCLSGRHIMYPTWTECFYCRSEGRLEGVTSDAPLIPRRPPLPMPAPNAASARLCPNGRHTMDPTWTECPFCVRSALARESERFRVFISSTFIDLQEYRQAVFSSILALGNTGEDMVHWSADERSAAAASRSRVQESDVLILLLAHRYGSIPEGSTESIVEAEYNAACSSNTPVLAFLIDENVPWPPQHIEWERHGQLAALKAKVRAEVVVKTFTTPDHLAALVSQALATFRERRQRASSALSTPRRITVRADSAADLKVRPDLTVQIGQAEDDLPLLLQIQRSRNLSEHFEAISKIIHRPGLQPPDALISTFRRSIEDHAMKVWADDGIKDVTMGDGSKQELFVVRTPLSFLFNSSLDSILAPRQKGKRRATAESVHRPTTQHVKPLQSAGGSNRFFGICIRTGRVYSVGRPRDRFGNLGEDWIEWRPFIFESVPHNFPDARFIIAGGGRIEEVLHDQYLQALLAAPIISGEEESIGKWVQVVIPRISVGKLILEMARRVGALHETGRVHGDLKPNNVLLSSAGPVPIDDFDLQPGQISPGYTPDWSAPEQVLGQPVSPASDIYPFGRLICHLIGGELTGEVRKFVGSAIGPRDEKEFDVFYDPFVRLQPENAAGPAHVLRFWTDVARSCLRFLPSERPQDMRMLVDQISSLLEEYPLQGTCSFRIENRLVMATFLDGGKGPARLMSVPSGN